MADVMDRMALAGYDLDRVLDEVRRERRRQDAKWGEQNHDPFHWLSIEGEELGEAMRAANEWWHQHPEHLAEYREEMIQVAAVAVAAVQCLDRGKWEKQHRGGSEDGTKRDDARVHASGG